MSKKHDEITTAIGSELSKSDELAKLGYSVIFDHGKEGDKKADVTTSWIGNGTEKDNRLSKIDIAIFEKHVDKPVLLIEIEESGDSPKKIIGAVMATLLADGISSTLQPNYPIGKWTTLLVLAKGEGETHQKRIRSLEARINQLAGGDNINRMKIGTIRLMLFQTPDDLKKTIMELLKTHPQYD